MRVANIALFTAADMSQDTLTSAPIPLFNAFGFAVQLGFTGAPIGSVSIYGSCDPCNEGGASTPAPTNFTIIASTTTAISAAGTLIINVVDCNYSWFEVIYTKTSGTGSLTARANVKSV